ncbi:MAG TPA: putative transporter small subunit [Burkholderiaceae bacterium]|nr:putative transporter small subunit [Burkholderiaceae bacterium]
MHQLSLTTVLLLLLCFYGFSFFMTLYILIWPALSAAVLAALSWGVWKDIRAARRKGQQLV